MSLFSKVHQTETLSGKLQQESIDNGQIEIVHLPQTVSAAGLCYLLRQVPAQRVVLVPPPEPSPTRELARTNAALWLVVRRQADALGQTVALVTRDERMRRLAHEAGLTTFSTLEGACHHTWPTARPRPVGMPPPPPRDRRRPVSQQRRGRLAARGRLARLLEGGPGSVPAIVETLGLALVLLCCLAMVFGVVAFVVPSATVTLVPALQPVANSITVTARPDIETVDSERRWIPARRIGQRVEGADSIEATGTRSAPDAPARGVVVFTNRQATEQEIPVGTIVATATGINVRFQTLEPAVLPAGIGAQVTVPVEALEPGPAGNVRAFSINTIEGPLSLTANVFNPQDMTGGSVKQVPVVKQADKDRLKARLLRQVTQEAYQALGKLLDEGEFVPPETVGTLVVAETYDRFTDEEASQVSLRLRLLATALAVDGQAADELALRALSEKIPRRGRLLSDSISYRHGEAVVSEDEDSGTPIVTFEVTASGVVVVDIDPAAVRAAIRGRTLADARQELESQWRLQSPPKLTLGPDWLLPVLRHLDFAWLPVPIADRVPWLPFRIHVRVQFEE